MTRRVVLAARAKRHVDAIDRWWRSVGRRSSLSGHVAVLEERVGRLNAQNALLRARLARVPVRRRPGYRAHERLEILWHAARYRLSVAVLLPASGSNPRIVPIQPVKGVVLMQGVERERRPDLVARKRLEFPERGGQDFRNSHGPTQHVDS